MPSERPPEPWDSFFRDLDLTLDQPVQLHCAGGFVISMLYGMPRPTVDVDVISVVPHDQIAPLDAAAGRGSRLHRLHGLYLQHVGVATVPENYLERLVEMFPGVYRRLRILGLEAYDLALSKLERNAARDREDVRYLARAVPLNLGILEQRYHSELRPYLSIPRRHDLTMRLWREMILEG